MSRSPSPIHHPPSTPPALVIGGGIAGASVAYFLAKRGVAVTVIDAGLHAASHVPSALINPVRGQSGGVDARALAGLSLTWTLLRELEAAGFRVPHGQTGVLRPLPDDRTRARFERNLPPALAHRWLSPAEFPVPLSPGWAHALWLPAGGWLDGAAFTRALLAASGARVIRGRAGWVDGGWGMVEGTTQKADGRRQMAPATVPAPSFSTSHRPQATSHQPPGTSPLVIRCGGSLGATWAGEAGAHRMGTLLTLDRAATEVPVSFGAYLAPAAAGGVLGATFEAPAPAWAGPGLPLASLGWLLGKGEALTDLSGVRVTGRWTGSRLSGLRAGRGADGVWHLTGLGSKGFLLGPLLARELASEIAGGGV